MKTLPPGQYRIGDPCYSIAEWEDFLDAFWATNENGDNGGVFMFRGEEVACWYTAYGDGCYDFGGFDIPVDAGCIAALPEAICTKDDGGWVGVHFSKEFVVMRDEDGTFRFGDRYIHTGDDDERHCSYCGR